MSTSSPPRAKRAAPLLGAQRPRIFSAPRASSSAGDEAVELAEMAGLILDDWQKFVLARSLGERDDGRWAAFEVGVVAPRQNGKGGIIEARSLAGLFLIGERLLIHSAHQFDTSLEAFRRLLALIEETPDFSRRVKRVSKSHGEEGIELIGGQRIRFRTRTKGGGRGFSGDCVFLDEAMILPESTHGALFPTLRARPNPQVWYLGSAVDQLIHEYGIVLARIRARGIRGDDPSLAYFEWSVDEKNPSDVDPTILDDPNAWAQANAALGIRITEEHMANERRSMDPRTFAVELLNIGDWPDPDGMSGEHVIDPDVWAELLDRDSKLMDPVCFAFDVTPDRAYGAISAAGLRPDDLAHVEVIEHKRGTGWMVDRIIELSENHHCVDVVCDGTGPAGSLIAPLDRRGIEVNAVSAKEHAQACGLFYDTIEQAALHHLGTAELAAAIDGAARRPLGDAWAWSRKASTVDISPLVSATLALWGSRGIKPKRKFNPDDYRIRRV